MKKICSFLSFAILFVYLSSCQKEVAEVANLPQEFKPNGNEILTTEKLIGEDKQHSSFEKAIDDGLGNFYFAGYINEQNVIGKIDKQGFIIWQKSINFRVNEIVLFYGEGNLEKSALIVGNDGNRAVVAIYDRNGTKLSDAYFNDFAINTFSDVRYRHTATNYYLCSAIGGAGNSANDVVPYWVNFSVNAANGQISKSIPNVSLPTQIRLTQYPRIRFNKFATGLFDGSGSQGGAVPNSITTNWETYISYIEQDAEGKKTLSAGMLGLNDKITYRVSGTVVVSGDIINTSLEIKWQRSIGGQTPNTPVFLGKSFVSINDITIVGSVVTKDGKASNLSSNGHSAAKIVVLNREDGSIISNREFSISQYDDVVSNMTPLYFTDANGIFNIETYVCGTVSNYSKNDYFYGYGWIGKLSGGTITNIRHFGLPEGRHYFYSIVPTEQDIYAFGFKNYIKKDGGHRAWFSQINRNRL